MLSDETHEVIDVLAMRPNVDEQLLSIFTEVSDGLEVHINTTIAEAMGRRGDASAV